MVLGASIVDELTPRETYQQLADLDSAALVDVRTHAEWSFVGIPDVSGLGKPFWPVEWVTYPAMTPNIGFTDQLLQRAGGELPDRLFVICRSGVRSMMAAQEVAQTMQQRGRCLHCTNVSEGFEGDLDEQGHRGKYNGWKAHGLPWRQS